MQRELELKFKTELIKFSSENAIDRKVETRIELDVRKDRALHYMYVQPDSIFFDIDLSDRNPLFMQESIKLQIGRRSFEWDRKTGELLMSRTLCVGL